MSKHTPGPWQKNGIVIVGADGADVCLMGEPAQYAGDIGKMCQNADANARLIAAAPDMLEALRRFEAYYPAGINPWLDEDTSLARAVIAKAEGQS